MTAKLHPLDIRNAYHEAGHFVAQFYFLRRPATELTLEHNIAPHPGLWCTEKLVLVRLAGGAVVRQRGVQSGQDSIDPGDASDRAHALDELCGAVERLPRLERKIAAFFRRPEVWRAVESTTEALLELRRIRGEDIQILACHVKLDLGRRLTKAEEALLASV
jgi:hypothetical protein